MDKLRDFLKSWPGRILLILCLSPLALLGIESYFYGSVDPNQVAQVGDARISQHEYQAEVNARRSELLAQISDPSLLNEDVLHEQVLENMINRALLQQEAGRLGMTISDAAITQLLQQEPAFLDESGQFSNERFAAILRQQGLTRDQLFADFRQQLMLATLNASIVGTAIYPMPAISRLLDLQLESREIWLHRIDWRPYQSQVSVSDDEINAYYQQNKDELKSEAMVDLAYIRLSPNSLQASDIPAVTGEDIERQYQLYLQENQLSDSRTFSQILLTGDNAQAQAQQLKAQLDAGADFAKLAAQHSDDPSAASGGAVGRLNLDVFGDDASRVRQALEGLSVGDVSEPVQTRYGYQLFQVTGDEGDGVPSLASMRDELQAQALAYNRQMAYTEKVTAINDLVADGFGIQDIAQQENVSVATINDYRRDNNQSQLSQPAVIRAAFDEFNIQDQAVSPSIEVGDSSIWVQPSNYRPVQTLSLEQARPIIQERLQQQKATELALAQAKRIADNIHSVSDINAQSADFVALGEVDRRSPLLDEAERRVAFSQPAPAGGVVTMTQSTEQGASVLVAGPVRTAPQAQLSDFEQRQAAAIIRDNMGQDQLQDYLHYLRLTYDVNVNDNAVHGASGF